MMIDRSPNLWMGLVAIEGSGSTDPILIRMIQNQSSALIVPQIPVFVNRDINATMFNMWNELHVGEVSSLDVFYWNPDISQLG